MGGDKLHAVAVHATQLMCAMAAELPARSTESLRTVAGITCRQYAKRLHKATAVRIEIILGERNRAELFTNGTNCWQVAPGSRRPVLVVVDERIADQNRCAYGNLEATQWKLHECTIPACGSGSVMPWAKHLFAHCLWFSNSARFHRWLPLVLQTCGPGTQSNSSVPG